MFVELGPHLDWRTLAVGPLVTCSSPVGLELRYADVYLPGVFSSSPKLTDGFFHDLFEFILRNIYSLNFAFVRLYPSSSNLLKIVFQ